MPQLRQNIITGDWVVIAPERAKRPSDFAQPDHEKKPAGADCPFCPESPAQKNRYPGEDTAKTFTIPNKFAAFLEDGQHEVRSYTPEEGFYTVKPAVGGHDVVVIKEHDTDLFNFDQATFTDLFTAIAKRYRHFRDNPAVEYVMAIYNHGPAAGASLDHPHAQIFASSIVPNHITKELHGSEQYYELNGRCVFCDMIVHEKREDVRVLAENEQFILFTFFAARFPFEIWLMPKEHQSSFEDLTKSQTTAMAELMEVGFKMLDTTLKNPSLNWFIHSLPTTTQSADHYHWHLEIAPRLSLYAGYELGSGVIIDVVSPEKAAEFLREPSSDEAKTPVTH